MLLYHFTERQLLPQILATGLSRGAVPVAPGRWLNAVWLTTDGGPAAHGLESGGAFMTEAQRQQAYEWTGTLPPPGARLPKSAEARIAVDIPPTDRNLHEWLPWARRHLSPEWLAQLHPVGGCNLNKARTWRLYFGVIDPSQFADVETQDEPRAVERPGAARISG
jgi:hypothetical protein